jgi:hypothetical protein
MKVTSEQVVPGKTTTIVDPIGATTQLAASPHTSPQVLRQIAAQTDWELRRLVATNPNTPTDTLWHLGVDFPEAILNNPIFELLQIEQPTLVAQIPHATLTSLLQCERVPIQFMEYAVGQQDYSLWLAVAYNAHTPSTILENLARKSRRQDRELIRAVAAHPNTPVALLAEIIEIGGNVAQIVAENPRTPIEVLEKILYKYGQTNDPMFTTLVALHPHLTPPLLMQMNLAPNAAAARSLWLGKQSATAPSQLIELAQSDWEIVQLAVVRHPQTPSTTIAQIWSKMRGNHPNRGQIDRLIYDSFVGNVNTPPQLREELRKLLKW